jgi:hypothetical protein
MAFDFFSIDNGRSGLTPVWARRNHSDLRWSLLRNFDHLFFLSHAGRVRGQGDDEVGPFVISGSYSGTKVHFIKEYIGQHSLQYDGKLTQPSHGSFELSGRWSVGADWSGRFEMSGHA